MTAICSKCRSELSITGDWGGREVACPKCKRVIRLLLGTILTLFLAAGAQAEPGRKFLWTELIAFDNAKADYGVGEYLSRMSVKPEGISFLIFDPELFHSHTDLSRDFEIGDLHCSYGAKLTQWALVVL